MKKIYPDELYLCALAKKCGKTIRANFNPGMKKGWKSDDTPITSTDTAINAEVCARIQKDFPHIQVLGEEESSERENPEYVILCDPVDGTIPFSHGLPISTFCISVLHDHKPIVGVIYDPFIDRMWHAERSKGSFLGNKRIRVSDKPTLHHAMVYAGILHPNISSTKPQYSLYDPFSILHELVKNKAIPTDVHSIAYFGGLVASGEFDATLFPVTQGWETSAMQIIVEEAGGKATDIYGKKLHYDDKGEIKGHIMSNGKIHDTLVNLVQKCPPAKHIK